MTAAVDAAREYYRALDEHDYDALAGLLAHGFVHDRPDLTLEGRDRFVRFMREERPDKETTHRVDGVYRDPDVEGSGDGGGDAVEVAVRGRLLAADGGRITDFVDVFTHGSDGVVRIDTYTH